MSTAVWDVPADTTLHENKLMRRLIYGGTVKTQVDDLTNNVLTRREQINSHVDLLMHAIKSCQAELHGMHKKKRYCFHRFL